MLLEKGDQLLMIGDSITDCGRARPVGEGFAAALGDGYVRLVSALLTAVYPEKVIRVVNMGVSGNTVRDLKARWETDVLALRPDWLSIMIGVNDVWRQFDSPHMVETHVLPEEYEDTLETLVKQTRPNLKGLVLMRPFYIEPLREDAMRSTVDLYGEIVKKIAEKYNAIFVDTQAAFDKLLQHGHSSRYSWDRVHPELSGHMAIAKAFLDAIGFDWNRRDF